MVVGVQSFEGLLQIPGEWKSPTFPRCNWNVGSLPCSWSVKLPKLIQIHNHTSLLILRSSWTFSVTSTVNFSSRFKARYLENFGELFHFWPLNSGPCEKIGSKKDGKGPRKYHTIFCHSCHSSHYCTCWKAASPGWAESQMPATLHGPHDLRGGQVWKGQSRPKLVFILKHVWQNWTFVCILFSYNFKAIAFPIPSYLNIQ